MADAAAATPPPAPPPPSASVPATDAAPFQYPPHHSFPPFYTLQPNLTTRASQLASWSALVTSYAAHTSTYRLTPTHPVFANARLRRALSAADAREVLAHMASRGAAEWIGADANEAWIWFRSAEDWAALLAGWAERTGQRNTVLTLYELLEGDAGAREPFHGLPVDMARRAVGVLARRGKASLFGDGDGVGVKFYA